ncbi:hypothetical protein [Lacrimispora xylanisolvens]|uniref:hypothetical protein n=1 Tax=Lacrimispora xylanisolvens TaxID=384636 RepID=UPI000CEC9EE7|nr:hypothetical protein [Hungatella xylanolytica]
MWIKKRMYAELKRRSAVLKKSTQGRPLGYEKIFNDVNCNTENLTEPMKDKAVNAKLNAAPSTLR